VKHRTLLLTILCIPGAANFLSGCTDSESLTTNCSVDGDCIERASVCLTAEGTCGGPYEEPGHQCLRDEECSGHRVCKPGFDGVLRCINGSTQELCLSDEGCPYAAICRAGSAVLPTTCLPPALPGEWCGANGDCTLGAVCDGSRCGVPVGGACEATECIESARCIAGDCWRRVRLGEPCDHDAQVDTPEPDMIARCFGGIAVLATGSRCSTGWPCEPGHACRPLAQSGVLACQPLGLPSEPCHPEIGGCVQGLGCVGASLAKPNAGWSCHVGLQQDCEDWSDDACQGGAVCRGTPENARLCQLPAQVLEDCDSDTDCAEHDGFPLLCSPALAACVIDDNRRCEEDKQCKVGRFCVRHSDGQSYCKTPGSEVFAPCQAQAHCAGQLICDLSVSECRIPVDQPCANTNTLGCVTSAVCWQGSGKCEPRRDNGQACESHALCWSGFCLTAGVCASGPLAAGANCLSDVDCAAKVCQADKTCK
jgi:hypothetical protein